MNNFISYILTMTLGIFLTFTAAPAAERVKVFELAESGILIEFPMSAKEIAAENAENARRAAMRAKHTKLSRKQVVIFELAESGQTIEFPAITTPAVQGFQDKEIATENANSGDGLIKVR